MSCCGRIRSLAAAPPPAATTSRVAPLTPPGAVRLRGRTPQGLAVRGPATGRSYAFGGGAAVAVDARDAAVLLRSRHFARA